MNTDSNNPPSNTEAWRRYDEFLITGAQSVAATPDPQPSAATPRADRLRANLVPLHVRLQSALARYPMEALADGLHLSQIWPLVTGRQRDKPRAFEVANALRALGWQRFRIYSDCTAPSGTFWFPAWVTQPDAKAALRCRKR